MSRKQRQTSDRRSRAPNDTRISVLVVDDDPAIRQFLAEVMKTSQTLKLVGQAATTDEGIHLAESLRPHVAVVDVRMPGGGGPQAVREMAARAPSTRVLAFSAMSDSRTVLEMLGAGAIGYLLKGVYPEEIVDGIAHAARGVGTVSESIDSHDISVAEQLPLRRELVSKTLDENQRSVVFQPIVDLRSREVLGVEAFTRFGEGDRSPKAWFDEARAVGLGVDLELTAIRAALSHLPLLPPNVFMALNISPTTLLSPRSRGALASVPPSRVVLELPDHETSNDYLAVVEVVQELRSEGVRVALDDVGAGSVGGQGLLVRPDFLKLDLSVTQGIGTPGPRRSLARHLVNLGSELGMKVVAEGIETPDQLEAALALGIDFGQGYYFGRPAPLDVQAPVGSQVSAKN